MNRIESAVASAIADVTPLEMDTAAVPVATPWAVAGIVVGAAALGYQVGFHLGGSLEDELDDELSAPERRVRGVSSHELLTTRTALLTQ